MDKDKFLAIKGGRAGQTAVVPLPVSGGEVTVRGLTVAEAQANAKTKDEAAMIAMGLVDPEITRDEAAVWMQDAPVGDYAAIVDAITELSGASEGAPKSSVRGVRKRRR